MNTWKPNMEETKLRYVNWWNHKGVVVNMWEHFQNGVIPHADVPLPEAPRDLWQRWFDPQWRARQLDWYVAHSSLMADMLPVANTQLGPGSLAAILGSRYEAGEDTIWIHPATDFTGEIHFDPQHPNWLLHLRLLAECKRLSQGHYYVGMPDLMEGLDVLAALKGTDQTLLDTVMQPEVVERQMQQINDVYFQVFDQLYDIIREGDEMAFCYFSSWAPGKMTKLQSDISTMISVDDYRRFVQPFIRQQCQRIDYTLYHLDGVGAIRHLPALLEIDELNAVQWTPGVGQPQGGNEKWYSLYRRILDAGKSVMACWVTLDELRPLLDHVGTDGLHLEMDFHDEDEVKRALDIVESCRQTTVTGLASAPLVGRPTLTQAAKDKVLVLDGGMGTMIQRYGLEEEDFRGERFSQHPCQLKGCNDLLPITRPDVVAGIHAAYLEAGADLIETDTFNAQRVSLADFSLQPLCREINLEACRVARAVARRYSTPSKPRYVLGSVGPTAKVCSMATGDQPPLSTETLREAYIEQMLALVDGGVDAILIETIFDTLNAKVALEAARKAMDDRFISLPIMLSFSVATPGGVNMLGQSIVSFLDGLDLTGVFSVGINCVADVTRMIPLVRQLGERYSTLVSLYPNAGMPDAEGVYHLPPEELRRQVWPLLDSHALNVIGGCCGTNETYIRAFADVVQPAPGIFLSPHNPQPVPVAYRQWTMSATAQATSHDAESVPEKPRPDSSSDGSLYDAILHGVTLQAETAAAAAARQGIDTQQLIDSQMIPAMEELGRRFEQGVAFVPQLLMAGRAMKAALKQLGNAPGAKPRAALGKVVIGTVKGDLHDIGKNLVASMMEGCGFEVVNIGIDVSAEKFVDEVRRHRPDILCMSALLTTTMSYMGEVVKALDEAGLRDSVKIMVGGAPVTQQFANKIGADGYTDNANSAVTFAKQLMARRVETDAE